MIYESLKTVYFVRHGESVHNTQPVFQSLDTPLSDKGIEQAKFIANRVSKIKFDKLISSSVVRTRQTAEYISEATGKPIVVSDLFTEVKKPSSIEGKPYDDEHAKEIWYDWVKSEYTPGLKVEDGENYNELIARTDKAIEFLENQPEKTLVVVTHGFIMKSILARILLQQTLTPESYRMFQKNAKTENTGLTVIGYSPSFDEDPCWRLWIYNDHAHLAE
jgi:broad specificity phosphatase PhoE